MRNADRIHAEWQRREVGETVFLHWASGLKVAQFEPNRVIAREGWGAFVLDRSDGAGTRLYARRRLKPGIGRWLYTILLELPHFGMERKMLLGIKSRAEAGAR